MLADPAVNGVTADTEALSYSSTDNQLSAISAILLFLMDDCFFCHASSLEMAISLLGWGRIFLPPNGHLHNSFYTLARPVTHASN